MKWKAINPLGMCLLLAAILLPGCQSSPSNESNSPERGAKPIFHENQNERLRPWRPRRPTLAMQGEALQQKTLNTPMAHGGRDMWYAGRNDRQPSVNAGYETATYETIVNQTYDRQGTVNGQPRDVYYNRTYRSSVQRTVR